MLYAGDMACTDTPTSGLVLAPRIQERTQVWQAWVQAFTLIFTVEAILKIMGWGWAFYWKNGWNKFDFLMVLTSIIDLCMSFTSTSLTHIRTLLRVQKLLRILRISRMFKLARRLQSLRSLFSTLVESLPAFWNVGALLMLFFFIYSYLGVQLFGSVVRQDSLNEHANFEYFLRAMLTLFRVATNDEWTGIMYDTMVKEPMCSEKLGNCGTWLAIPYFATFVVIVSLIMMNLFTAVIIENFEKQQDRENWTLSPNVLDTFVDLWAEFDDGVCIASSGISKAGSGSMDVNELEVFLKRLPPPLGLGKTAANYSVFQFIKDLDVPLVNGRVTFYRTAYELVRRVTEAVIPDGPIKDELSKLIIKHFGDALPGGLETASIAMAVKKLQRKWRASSRAFKVIRRKDLKAERIALKCPAFSDVLAHKDENIAALKLYLEQPSEDRELQKKGYRPLQGLGITFTNVVDEVNSATGKMKQSSQRTRRYNSQEEIPSRNSNTWMKRVSAVLFGKEIPKFEPVPKPTIRGGNSLGYIKGFADYVPPVAREPDN